MRYIHYSADCSPALHHTCPGGRCQGTHDLPSKSGASAAPAFVAGVWVHVKDPAQRGWVRQVLPFMALVSTLVVKGPTSEHRGSSGNADRPVEGLSIGIGITDPCALSVVDIGLADQLNVAGPLKDHYEVGAAELKVAQLFSFV